MAAAAHQFTTPETMKMREATMFATPSSRDLSTMARWNGIEVRIAVVARTRTPAPAPK